MKPATLDRLLAVLVLAMAGTGAASLRFGDPSGGWLFVLHGLLGGPLAIAIVLKLRSSVGRAVASGRWSRLLLGLTVSLAAIASLVGGYAWVASGELLSVGSWTLLTLHAWAGLALVPLAAVHLLPHRWRLLWPRPGSPSPMRLPDPGRRSIVITGLLGLAGLGLFGVAQLLDRIRGGERRFTGSRWLPAGGIPPATTFLGDTPPPDEVDTWRVSVSGRVDRTLDLDLETLRTIGRTETSAVLDCTSGWAIETAWAGVSLRAALDAAGVFRDARRVTVRSATGWTANLPLDEARGCLLALEVAGAPLPIANGAPVRLVAPNRRGLDWVKWVREIIVD